jgi:hypothetical protein|uniref:Uncharacterized protein n=1 Tax=viral metagenome TaxID=1070528 RepID=A0A6C0EC33_9ZZZZ
MDLILNENENYNKCIDEIENIKKNKSCTSIDINKIKIGELIYIIFMPYSQKYIYDLYPKCGYVQSIEIINSINPFTNKTEENYNIIIKNMSNIDENLLHDGVSYFGQSLGYDYMIYLINE